jgi:hypothetical protein
MHCTCYIWLHVIHLYHKSACFQEKFSDTDISKETCCLFLPFRYMYRCMQEWGGLVRGQLKTSGPGKTILFGTCARGTYVFTSEFCLFILVSHISLGEVAGGAPAGCNQSYVTHWPVRDACCSAPSRLFGTGPSQVGTSSFWQCACKKKYLQVAVFPFRFNNTWLKLDLQSIFYSWRFLQRVLLSSKVAIKCTLICVNIVC